MNKCVLWIPRPGATSDMIQQGYIDTLRHLGWKVYVGDPKTKLCCGQWIKEHGIQLIMTFSKYGVRQLPVDVINNNNVAVAINSLPLNPTNNTIDGLYELAHDDEPYWVGKINNSIVHTHLEQNVWDEFMSGWQNSGIDILHLPVAGNIIKAMPSNCSVLTDVAMVANFSHRQDIMRKLITPLFKRLDLLGYSYQAFGDKIWQLAGLDYNGPLIGDVNKLAHVYATCKGCPNVHTERQISLKACVNERSFMIQLCGGVQVSDNPIAAQYFGSNLLVSTSVTDFIKKVIGSIENHALKFDQIRIDVEHVANNHTYFNRLTELFRSLGLTEFCREAEYEGSRMAVRHCLELNARLSAEERGVCYEENVV